LRGNEDQVPELADLNRRIASFEQHKARLTEQLVGRTTREGEQVSVGGASLARIGQLTTQIEAQKLAISQLTAQIESVEQNLEQYRGKLQGIPRQTIESEQLQRRLTQAEEFYRDIVVELQRTILAEESELGYVNVVRAAGMPSVPVSPNMKVNAILGLLLGIGFGVGLAFLMQAANTRLHGPDDVQNKGYSVAGLIPRMDDEIKAMYSGSETVEMDGRQVSTSLMPLLNPWSPITENYRLIRTNLQHARGPAGAPQIIMLTSPEPGDGKTTTAVNLAITMALSGRRVLLVDGDMRRPTVHKVLGLERGPGLGDILEAEALGGADMLPAKHVGVEGLDVLTAGCPQRVTAEALDSNRMKQLLLTVRAEYDAIVVDTPPVLAASDPLIVAPQCDATLVVVSTATTESEALHATRDTLAAIGVRIAGVVLNRYTPESSGGYKYGYGYDRRYEYTAA
jgi:capsular exopolysaccharide synthesis family protein